MALVDIAATLEDNLLKPEELGWKTLSRTTFDTGTISSFASKMRFLTSKTSMTHSL
jgi:hypothetical protein